ncbi:MAG: helix-turn-helix transcriptional regulator [Roseburia sp.]|nr:helix-turn-helix transcriptional regulator [Roseburia sp.]
MSTVNLPEIGKRIRQRRKELGISQQEACRKLNISQNHYSRIENGYAGMSLELLLEISSYLNLTTDYVLTGNYPTQTGPAAMENFNRLPLLEQKYIERSINLFCDYLDDCKKYHS